MRSILTGIAIVALTAGAASAADGNPIGGVGVSVEDVKKAGGKTTVKEAGAQTTSYSNIKKPPGVTVGGKPGKTEAGATITASASNVKSPPNVTATGKPEVEKLEGRKGRGIAVSRAGGAY